MSSNKEGDLSVQVEIVEPPERDNQLLDSQRSFFQPGEPSDPSQSGINGEEDNVKAPEKKLTLFAFRLAILEKSASHLGTLAFIWATVVLLGGFAINLERKDFVYVTIILLTEGTRTFGRSHELEWQHHSTWTLEAAGRNSFRALQSSSDFLLQATKAIFHPFSFCKGGEDQIRKSSDAAVRPLQERVLQRKAGRRWNSPDVELLPRASWLFVSKNISSVLILLQVLSAIFCVILCLMRLFEQDYGEVTPESKNRGLALNLFYGVALGAAVMFLTEKAYWTWMFSFRKLLEKANQECKFGPSGIKAIRRFYYDTYSKCIDGSIFDGLKMDMVTFAKDLLGSESFDEQLMGAQILYTFVNDENFDHGTLKKLGTSTSAIEKLIEMLNWRNPAQEKIRMYAASIVSKLAGKRQHAIRVAGISGAMESISTLLHIGNSSSLNHADVHVIHEANHEITIFNLLGLLILKKLAYDQDNCAKIGMTRNLLPRIIIFTRTSHNLLRNDRVPDSLIKAVQRSLQVVKLLVRTTGSTGKRLRRQISEIVFTVSNIREIIQSGERHILLQKLGIEILALLAMDETGKKMIGGTGGIINLLLSIFLEPGFTEDENMLKDEAGEAVTMLTQRSQKNCDRILKEGKVIDQLISVLHEPRRQIRASRILRNLCAYSRNEYNHILKSTKTVMPMVLKTIMMAEEKLVEPLIGMSIQICKLMELVEFNQALELSNIKDAQLVEKLVQILKQYAYPNIKVPRIRRFVVELAMWMMQSNKNYLRLFKNSEMEKLLEHIAETTSELESFHGFSGSVGLIRHRTSFSTLVETTLKLLHDK